MSFSEPRRDPENNEKSLLREVAKSAGKRVLDIGCGEGRLTHHFAEDAVMVVGTDLELDKLVFSTSINAKDSRSNPAFTTAAAQNLPFVKESFDLAVFSWSL
jgi:ubiquinone/menaquinone biosynthesis C-methylase UbiE